MVQLSTIEHLIADYQPSERAKAIVDSAKAVFLVGVMGAGKDTIKQKLLETGQFYHIISHTTRPKRSNNGLMEVDGQDYHFVSLEQAEEMLRQQEFIEAKFFDGKIYGTSLMEFERAMAAGQRPLTDIEVQGVEEYCKISQSALPIFIIPPSFEQWFERVRARYSDSEEFAQRWESRRLVAQTELQVALSNLRYRWLINDDLNQAVVEIQQIIQGLDDQAQQQRAQRLAQQLLQELQRKDG